MAGNLQSGRRRIYETDKDLALPPLEMSEESIFDYIVALNLAVAADKIDPRRADTLKDAANIALRAVRQASERQAEDELRQMYDDVKELLNKPLAFETAAREHGKCPMCSQSLKQSPALHGTHQADAEDKPKRTKGSRKKSTTGT